MTDCYALIQLKWYVSGDSDSDRADNEGVGQDYRQTSFKVCLDNV